MSFYDSKSIETETFSCKFSDAKRRYLLFAKNHFNKLQYIPFIVECKITDGRYFRGRSTTHLLLRIKR
jgi:hypothetical protein